MKNLTVKNFKQNKAINIFEIWASHKNLMIKSTNAKDTLRQESTHQAGASNYPSNGAIGNENNRCLALHQIHRTSLKKGSNQAQEFD